jgi:hypothetical protein
MDNSIWNDVIEPLLKHIDNNIWNILTEPTKQADKTYILQQKHM